MARSIWSLVVENALRVAIGSLAAALFWVGSSIAALEREMVDLKARYASLRERTDESSRQTAQRLDRVEAQMTSLNAHTLDIIRTLTRLEGRIEQRQTAPSVSVNPPAR